MARSYKGKKILKNIKGILHKKIKLSFKFTIPFFIIVAAVLIFGNFTLCVSEYTYSSEKVPHGFDGYKIAQVSDFHNTKNRFICDALCDSLIAENPDIIFITGDFIDANKTDTDYSLEYAARFCEIAPCYFITGNHEINYSITHNDDYLRYINGLRQCGVCVLESETAELKNGNDVIYLSGIDDLYKRGYPLADSADYLCSLTETGDSLNILLSHQPQQIDVYSEHGFDLVFSGHAHGGQVRLFGKGLYAPNQGYFPKYTSGMNTAGNTTYIISRGIGNSIIPVRVFDRPELVYCTLKMKG